MFENPINKLRFWCHKVIPLVYDEALSYYEVLCKVAKKINELITDVNGLHDTVVFQVNGKEPTDGNVQLEAEDFAGAFVGSINGITPEEDGSITIDAEDVGAMPADERVVKTINGISPNADGSILAGTVRSVNGKSPSALPTPGSIALNASDVGALPNSIDPVESVNGIAPDAQGNVNVGTVKSVNSTLPDANGNVNLPTVAGVTSVDGVGADAQGNVQINAVKSVNGETPNAQGAVTIDVGTVKSVNGETPNAQGAVTIDVGVKTINNVTPTNGNLAISDAETPTTIMHNAVEDYNSTNIDTSKDHLTRERIWKNIVKTDFEFTPLIALEYNSKILVDTIILAHENIAVPFKLYGSDGNAYSFQIKTDGHLYAAQNVPANIRISGYVILITQANNNSIIVS